MRSFTFFTFDTSYFKPYFLTLKTTFLLFFGLFFWALSTQAQKPNEHKKYYIHRASSVIKIDGKATEQAWQDAKTEREFHQVLPMDTSMAWVKTEVKLCYDDKNLYILFVNYDSLDGPLMVESMRRDFSFSKNDNDLVFIDTFNDLTTGFSFGSNAGGGQWDGLMSNGSNVDISWDNKWQSEVSKTDDYWIWEAAIPFKTLRYKEGIDHWGINFSRNDLKSTEKSAWAPVPRQFPTASLAHTGDLIWDNPPPKPGRNISLIPYVNIGGTKDFENNKPGEFNREVGLDAKIGLSSSLNLDLTINPDFSQVDVDVQITNLDRFELFFPERRQFFLENGDIFNSFGYNRLRPFFSRRIGLNAPIYYGGKLSGKLNNQWRIGAMSMQTGKSTSGQAGSMFNVLSLQRRVLKRSYVSGIFVNRDLIGSNNPDATNALGAYNRTAGLEFNLASEDNKWEGKTFVLKTFTPLREEENTIIAGDLSRTTKNLAFGMQIESVGKGVQANEVGFVQRKNYVLLNPSLEYIFFPSKGIILSHGPGFFINQFLNRGTGKNFEYLYVLTYNATFRNRSVLRGFRSQDYVELQNNFDPTNYTGHQINAFSNHTWNAFGLSFDSKPQSVFTYGFNTRFGGYYADGNRTRLGANMGYRIQPYASLLLSGEYNHIEFKSDGRLPEALKNTEHDLWLLSSRLDVTLTNKIYFTNFVQYNKQQNNLNINTRFQWRYSPASDLFIVYTDNYLAENIQVRNRALVLKFTYWWNM